MSTVFFVYPKLNFKSYILNNSVYYQFKCPNDFYFKLFSLINQVNGSNYSYVSLIIQFNNCLFFTNLNLKNVFFQTIQFSISLQFKCENGSISNNSI